MASLVDDQFDDEDEIPNIENVLGQHRNLYSKFLQQYKEVERFGFEICKTNTGSTIFVEYNIEEKMFEMFVDDKSICFFTLESDFKRLISLFTNTKVYKIK